MSVPILKATNLKKSYHIGGKPIAVLEGVEMTINPGDHIAITGSSGSGKSTLLTLLAGMDKPDHGEIIFDGQDITKFSEVEISKLRRFDFGFVFQSFHLVPSLSALENVMFPLELTGLKFNRAYELATKMIQRVGLGRRINSFPHQLSGGEKQRVAIARALVHQPRILFADEPTGNLDEVNSQQVMKLLLELQKEMGSALIVVTHELEIAEQADRILRLERGKIL